MFIRSCILAALAGGLFGFSDLAQTSDIQTLFAQLNQPSSTDRAARKILEVASKNPEARNYVADRLPEMIQKLATDERWKNAVRLAGQLKAVETVPSLANAMRRGPIGPPAQTFTEEERLVDDIVGQALAQIGDPAVPALAEFLKLDKLELRRRAARILVHINSPRSRTVLSDHLPEENDARLKTWIRLRLKS